jgi:hypothetical protein
MASEKQFLFFKSLYDEEVQRTQQLRDHAKNYLSLATFYSAFVAFVVQQMRPSTPLPIAIFLASVICMLLAFLLALWASGIADFEVANNPEDVVDEFGDEPMSDEAFFDNRIGDFVVASEGNSEVNDRKAFQLVIAGYALLGGIVLHACFIVLSIA